LGRAHWPPTAYGRGSAINSQDGLFTLVERGVERGEPVQRTCLIGSISRALADGPRAFQAVLERFGTLDILVNSAGIAHVGNVEQTSEEDFDRLYAVNVKGVYNCLKAGVPAMAPS
jgi:2-keto-3-deoxy-L-fuconate dehydrogenase